MAALISSSPHDHGKRSTGQVMFEVILAALPGIAVQTWLFGIGILTNIILACVVCLLCEAGVMLLRQRPVRFTLSDNSALVTAVLLGLALPAMAPWWLVTIGAMFAIVFAKQLYGGLGNNPFNPAMAAYVMLLISFPVLMTDWSSAQQVADGITAATPLDTLKTNISQGMTLSESLQGPAFGVFSGANWEWVNLAYLLGGLWLVYRKVISWHIPVSLLAGLAVMTLVGQLINADHFAGLLLHMFSGATMLAAFFIATDPVSASTTPRGRLIYGALIGVLIWLIRTLGGYPDGVAFAVLLTNMAVPLIDHFTQPRTYGHRLRDLED